MEPCDVIQYVGLPGVTKTCSEAVVRLLQFGDQVKRVRILSRAGRHALLLSVNIDENIAVKTGFTSGYGGEGPHAFSWILALLHRYGAEIKEYDVSQGILDRLDRSSLTQEDLSLLDGTRPVLPSRWYNYILEAHWQDQYQILYQYFPPVIPYSIVDTRLMDVALRLFENPDESLLTGYRRLEDAIRARTGIDEYGQRLLSQAFQGERAKLTWNGLNPGECTGRASLFTGTYGAYRNPRAHRELAKDPRDTLAEFLLLNQLYLLERSASETVHQGQDTASNHT